MAGWVPVSNSPSARNGLWSRPVAPPMPLDPQRAAAFQSTDMVRDHFLRSSSSLTNLNQTLSDPRASGLARGAALGDATRQLGNALQTADALSHDLDVAMGNSPTYQAITKSATGQAIIGTTRAAAQVIVPATNVAGSLGDVATAQTMAARDFTDWQRVMADPTAHPALKFVATAKMTSSASILVRNQRLAIQAIQQADENYLANPAYQRLVNSAGNQRTMQALAVADQVMSSPAFTALQLAGTAGGIVVGAVALPKIVASVGTNYTKLEHALYDGKATEDQKLDAIADLSRSSAGTIQAVQGIRLSALTMGQLAASTKTLGPLMELLQPTGTLAHALSGFGRVMSVLSPLADAGMLVADAVKLKHVFADPKATWGAKARAILNVGLDGLKLGTWLMPQTLGLRIAYVGASFVQLGMVLFDMRRSMTPVVQQLGAGLSLALTHPDQALKATGHQVAEGMLYVSNHVSAAADALAWGVVHPLEAIQVVGATIASLVTGAKVLGGVIKDSAAVVDRTSHGKPAPEAPPAPPVGLKSPFLPPIGLIAQPIGTVPA